MSEFVFRLPDIGEGITEAELVKWHVKAGDHVKEGDALADVMTEKATVELAAPVSGLVRLTRGDEGAKLPVGSELVVFEVADAAEPPRQVKSTVATQLMPAAPLAVAASREAKLGKVLAAPAVRARAKALGIALGTIKGSGPSGQIRHEDLDRFLVKRAPPPQALAQTMAPAEAGSEDVKIFGLRRRIAERMQDANRRIPHFTYVEEVDVTTLEALRQTLNAEHPNRSHLTVLPFLIRALIAAIAKYPAVNGHFDDEQGIVRRFQAVHVGIATQTERGLLVPVISHAEKKDIWQLATEIARLSDLARAGKADRNELSGSTITVTSLGALGGIMATPIINPPEVAVIGVNRIVERPVIIDGAVASRKMMNLSSSFDHRIIDGYVGAAFIAEVRGRLQDPESCMNRVGKDDANCESPP